jgi:transcription antitermination factor NusG
MVYYSVASDISCKYKVGDSVEVDSGPFGSKAIVQEVNSTNYILVLGVVRLCAQNEDK